MSSHSLIDPYGSAPPCRFCEHWGGDIPGTPHIRCVHEDGAQVKADGEHGCVFWVRAIGTDDLPQVQAAHTDAY